MWPRMKAKLSSSTQSWKNCHYVRSGFLERGTTPVNESKTREPTKEKEGSGNSTPALMGLTRRLVTDLKDWPDPANPGLGHPNPAGSTGPTARTRTLLEPAEMLRTSGGFSGASDSTAQHPVLHDYSPPPDQQVVSDLWKGPPSI